MSRQDQVVSTVGEVPSQPIAGLSIRDPVPSGSRGARGGGARTRRGDRRRSEHNSQHQRSVMASVDRSIGTLAGPMSSGIDTGKRAVTELLPIVLRRLLFLFNAYWYNTCIRAVRPLHNFMVLQGMHRRCMRVFWRAAAVRLFQARRTCTHPAQLGIEYTIQAVDNVRSFVTILPRPLFAAIMQIGRFTVNGHEVAPRRALPSPAIVAHGLPPIAGFEGSASWDFRLVRNMLTNWPEAGIPAGPLFDYFSDFELLPDFVFESHPIAPRPWGPLVFFRPTQQTRRLYAEHLDAADNTAWTNWIALFPNELVRPYQLDDLHGSFSQAVRITAKRDEEGEENLTAQAQIEVPHESVVLAGAVGLGLDIDIARSSYLQADVSAAARYTIPGTSCVSSILA